MDINKLYLKKEYLKKINKIFYSSNWLPSAKIKNIFIQDYYKKLKESVITSDFKKAKKPMQYQYEYAKLSKEIKELFESKEFLNFISKITNIKIKSIEGEIRRFTWKDYTLLHDESVEKENIDIILEFTDNWKEIFGGYTTYTNLQGNSSIINPEPNTLLIIKRTKQVQKFIKYLNHKSKNKYRYAVFAEVTC